MSYLHVVCGKSVQDFENELIRRAEQEFKTRGGGPWVDLADTYARQLQRIIVHPLPEEMDATNSQDEDEISVKRLDMRNTEYDNFFRWGIRGGSTGNHRIIYAIHEGFIIVMLHYFDKRYNGMIKRDDLKPAEEFYEKYCMSPSYY